MSRTDAYGRWRLKLRVVNRLKRLGAGPDLIKRARDAANEAARELDVAARKEPRRW